MGPSETDDGRAAFEPVKPHLRQAIARRRIAGGWNDDGSPVPRAKKAYEQIADELRSMILAGELKSGERLPNESELAVEFAVSRSTIREALRVLSTQHLLQTKRGTKGGSFVMRPSLEAISELFGANIGLLAESENLSLGDFIDVREMFEVEAARLAALRCDERDLAMLRATLPSDPSIPATSTQFRRNRFFHTHLVLSTRNTLLYVSAKPVYSVLQTHLSLLDLPERFHSTILNHHKIILEAIESGDSDASGSLMRDHLAFLRPYYHYAWNQGGSDV